MTRLQYSNTTRDDRKRKLRHILKHDIDINNPESCYDFFASKINDGCNTSALNHYVKALNSWYKYKNLDHKFDLYKENSKPIKIPTKAEVKAIIKSFDRTWKGKTAKTMTYLLANSGMRISEICNIKLDDVDWHRHSITVTGKGNKTRVIPLKPYVLHDVHRPSIINYINGHRKNKSKDYLFTWINKTITPSDFRVYFKTVVRKAGVGWIHPHSLRHYYATMLLKSNVNVKIVQIILGHSSIKTTSRYLHMLDNDIFQAIQRTNFDDLLFSLTNLYGEMPYGPEETYNFSSLELCQGGDIFV